MNRVDTSNNTTINAGVVRAFLLFAFALSLSAIAVFAAPVAPTTLTPGASTSRDLSQLPAQSVNAIGGNVTEITINALTITRSWQGYYGNITGSFTLGDASNNTFYNWSAAHPKGQIYATRVNSITWGSVGCALLNNVSTEETYLSQVPTDVDSVRNTFAKNTHPAFNVGATSFTTNLCGYTTNGYVNNNSQNSNFTMVLLASGTNIIYTTLTNGSVTGFDGKQHDFELLVGENEKTTPGVTAYYFWTEFT